MQTGHAYNPSTWKEEAATTARVQIHPQLYRVWGQPRLHETPCQNTKIKIKDVGEAEYGGSSL